LFTRRLNSGKTVALSTRSCTDFETTCVSVFRPTLDNHRFLIQTLVDPEFSAGLTGISPRQDTAPARIEIRKHFFVSSVDITPYHSAKCQLDAQAYQSALSSVQPTHQSTDAEHIGHAQCSSVVESTMIMWTQFDPE
jgi:hypothetical protein